MKFIAIRSNFKEGIDAVSRSSGDASHLPILQNILIDASENRIKLSTTNLELASSFYVPGKVIEKGRITAPLSVLLGVIHNLQTDRMNFELQGEKLTITTDNYHAEIKGAPADEFPIIPKIKEEEGRVAFKGTALKDALARAIAATQFSDLRPELNSVLFDVHEEEIGVVATDSFRLAEQKLRKNQFTAHKEKETQLLIPLKAAHEALRAVRESDTVIVSYDNTQVLFSAEQWELVSRLMEGSFPDYKAVIPDTCATSALLPKDEFINAVKLASTFTSNNEVRVSFVKQKRVVEIFSTHQTVGENKYVLPAKIDGNDASASFNWRYLQDGLKTIKEGDVYFGINDDTKPALIRSAKEAGYVYVLMPVLRA